MDINLHCNSLKCRAQLSDKAVVTTCSHIFCLECSVSLGLSNTAGGSRICPACQTHLANPDDVVESALNPSEDYKTSVLSGLGPTVIMECAARGLAFYSYQTTQEILYQEFLAKNLTEKCHVLNGQMDKVIQEANAEIHNMRERLEGLQIEQDALKQKNHELFTAFREKSKMAQQTQKMYQALKTQIMAQQVATAASVEADHAIHTGQPTDRFVERVGGAMSSIRKPRSTRMYGQSMAEDRGMEQLHSRPRSPRKKLGSWSSQLQETRLYSSQSGLPGAATPSQHRTRLPVPTSGHHGRAAYDLSSRLQATPVARQPLGSISGNAFGAKGGGYGLSSRLRAN